jgi:hypothetical protein
VSQTDTNRTLLFFLFHMKMVLYHMKMVCFHMKMSRFEVVLLKGDLSIGDSWKRLRVHIDPSSGFRPERVRLQCQPERLGKIHRNTIDQQH